MNTMTAPPVVTLTVFHFAGWRRGWAFAQMGLARPLLRNVPGLQFWKMMGAGGGLGFTLRPDWGRYALLSVWRDQESSKNFFADSRFIRRYRRAASRLSTLVLQPIATHGNWGGGNPFLPTLRRQPEPDEPIAVLTRASIRPLRSRAFWGQVPRVNQEIAETPGLIASIGVGELPFIRQATFSIWENAAAMKAFAYGRPEHRNAIKQTRSEGWYSEEMFTRFVVVGGMGELPL